MLNSVALDLAADIIQRDGWHQGGYAPEPETNGTPIAGLPVCMMGAIYSAQGENIYWNAALDCWYGFDDYDPEMGAAEVVREYLSDAIRGPFPSVPQWNDAAGRTVAEVIEVLRACALIEAAREEQDAAWETYTEVVTA